jgi:hypothetical protein
LTLVGLVSTYIATAPWLWAQGCGLLLLLTRVQPPFQMARLVHVLEQQVPLLETLAAVGTDISALLC